MRHYCSKFTIDKSGNSEKVSERMSEGERVSFYCTRTISLSASFSFGRLLFSVLVRLATLSGSLYPIGVAKTITPSPRRQLGKVSG